MTSFRFDVIRLSDKVVASDIYIAAAEQLSCQIKDDTYTMISWYIKKLDLFDEQVR